MQPVFILVNVLNQLQHLKIYLLKGEKLLSPEVKFLFRAVALSKDGISNEKQEEVPWFDEKNPKATHSLSKV